ASRAFFARGGIPLCYQIQILSGFALLIQSDMTLYHHGVFQFGITHLDVPY
ncbi:MAG: hypothetical protein ACD_46C00463G0010, partial [uncultured bacterium]